MTIQDASKIKENILNFLQTSGPSLPIQISKNVKIDSLFGSAFLSELLREQKIKITDLKVGTSPVYYIQGTENGLEKYSDYLKPKEKEAFLLLKDNSFLEDEPQNPAIRVALRNIKDFAKPFKVGEKIIWRYFLIPITEYKKQNIPTQEKKANQNPETKEKEPETKLPKSFVSNIQQSFEEKNDIKDETKKEEPKIEIEKKQVEKPKEDAISNTQNKPSNFQSPVSSFTNPLATKPNEKQKEEKPKPEFCKKIISMIEKNNWEIIEEIESKAKEYNALVQVNSDLGPIIFKLQAKDKKTVNENDLSKLLGEAQSIPLPALFMTYGESKKKTNEFLSKYMSVIKYKQIE